jgi:hypothetical protein
VLSESAVNIVRMSVLSRRQKWHELLDYTVPYCVHE